MFGYTSPQMPQPSKKEQIVAAAKAVFLDKGYYATTMDDIAEAAQTTKRTVYNHFENKEALFREVIGMGVELFMAKLPELDDDDQNIEEVLTGFLARFVELCTWKGAVKMQLIVLAVRDQFPELCAKLFNTIDQRTGNRLAKYLKNLMERRCLAEGDEETLAKQLFGLCTASQQFSALFQLRAPLEAQPTAELNPEVDKEAIRAGVRLFLSALALPRKSRSVVSAG